MPIKISVITISFNNKEGLESTLKNVISQDYNDYEYIVIDGGSKDGSKELLEKHSENITYWVSEPDNGIYNALNKGIKAAKGEYLFFLNAGDLFINKSSLRNAAKHVCDEDIVYFDIVVKGQGQDFVKKCPAELDFNFFYKDTLPHQASFMKTEAFTKIGLYDESLKIVADWKWYMIGICFSELTYKKINETFSIFFLDGISSSNQEIVDKERQSILSTLPAILLNTAKRIDEQNAEIKDLKEFQNKFNHLKKYRLVKLLDSLRLIKIPK